MVCFQLYNIESVAKGYLKMTHNVTADVRYFSFSGFDSSMEPGISVTGSDFYCFLLLSKYSAIIQRIACKYEMKVQVQSILLCNRVARAIVLGTFLYRCVTIGLL